MDRERLIDDALHEPVQAISYRLHRWLRGLFPDRALLEGNDQTFNLEGYGRAGHCALEENALPLSQHLTYWLGPSGALHRAQQTWFAVDWRGERLDVLVMHWNDNMSSPYPGHDEPPRAAGPGHPRPPQPLRPQVSVRLARP